MPLPSAASGSEADIQARLAELESRAAELEAEKAQAGARERDLRARENPETGVSFAREIFEIQQAQRVLEVEIDLVRKKIRRLQLGFAEDAVPSSQPQDGFLF